MAKEVSLGRQGMSAFTHMSSLLRATATSTFTNPGATDTVVDHHAASGLTPPEVGITLAVLLGLWLICLFIGVLCKVFNKPNKEAAPYVQSKLFQPSAAGYGSRTAMQNGRLNAPPTQQFGSRVSLLANAGPMGYDAGDHSLGSLDSHGTADSSGRSHGHTRGQSSGIQLPGATMASSRKTAARHPGYTTGYGPDGSGFKPGQAVNIGGITPAGPSSPEASRSVLPPHARVGLGPPPAADARRRSRYSKAVSRRVDSIGPGQLRKSMYMNGDEGNGERPRRVSRKFSDGAETNQGGLRRVDSVGKGDHRRRSQYHQQTPSYASRGTSIYTNNHQGDKAVFLSAQADNFGSGRPSDPLNARSAFLAMPPNRSRSGSNTSDGSAMHTPTRQYSHSSSDAGSVPSPSIPMIGKPFPHGMAGNPGVNGYPMGNGFPGGGAPRAPYAQVPLAAGGRQIV